MSNAAWVVRGNWIWQNRFILQSGAEGIKLVIVNWQEWV